MQRTIWCLLTLLMTLVLALAAFTQPPPEPPADGPDLPNNAEPERLKTAPTRLDDEASSDIEMGKGEAPNVVLVKIGPATVVAGKPLTTEIIVRNQGRVPVYQVDVEDEVPANAKFLRAQPEAATNGNRLMWTIEALKPGQERRFKVEVQPAGDTEVKSRAKVTYSTVAGVKTRILRPQLAVRKTGPEKVAIGDTVTFNIEVSNTGTAPATGVMIRDLLPEGLEHVRGPEVESDIGTLAPGEKRTIKLNVKAAKQGRLVNEVVVTGDGNLRATAMAPVIVGRPDLRLVKTGPTERYLNTAAVFYLQVTNAGDAPARKVQLIDVMPAGFKFVEASDGGRYDSQSNTVQWSFDSLQPDEDRRVAVRVNITDSGELRNHAVARGEPGVDAKAEAVVRVIGIPAMLLEVVDRSDPIEVGAETVYEIRVLNQGSAANTNVQVMALVPQGMKPLRANGAMPHRIQGQQVIFEPIKQLAPKAEEKIQVTVRGESPGDHRFKVQLQSDQMRIPVSEEESTHVYADK